MEDGIDNEKSTINEGLFKSRLKMIPHSDRILELAVDWLTLPCCLLISSADYERVSTLTTSELLV